MKSPTIPKTIRPPHYAGDDQKEGQIAPFSDQNRPDKVVDQLGHKRRDKQEGAPYYIMGPVEPDHGGYHYERGPSWARQSMNISAISKEAAGMPVTASLTPPMND